MINEKIRYWEWFSTYHNTTVIDLSYSNPPSIKSKDLDMLGVNWKKNIDFGRIYFGGSAQLKEAISHMYHVSDENVFVGGSASDTNNLVLDALIRRGDKILIENPVYPPLRLAAKRISDLRGASVKKFDRSYSNKFKIDMNQIEGLINEKTKLVILTNLHNPSGVKTTKEEFDELNRLINKKSGGFVMVDEVYRRYVPSLPSVYPLVENGFCTDSLTKFYGMGSLRVGWIVGNPEVINEFKAMQEYRGVANCSFNEDLAVEILEHKDFFDSRLDNVVKNVVLVEDWVSKTPGVSWVKPDGGLIGFLKLRGVGNTLNFTDFLATKYNTLVAPGEFYGSPGFVRIVYGIEDSNMLHQALKNLGKALTEYKRS